MKPFFYILLFFGFLLSCGSAQNIATNGSESTEQDVVRIANDEIAYQIIIIEPGFNFWLKSVAKPEGYYSQHYLEARNRLYVQAWNQRVMQAINFDPNLYEMRIDYQYNIDYGYEVNYKLYNYFLYFQLKHKQKLTTLYPRI